jgi:hypothetical protein
MATYKNTVLITEEGLPFYNQRLEGRCIYYDIYHTGNGPDLYHAITPEGKGIRLRSTQIDVSDYNDQEKQEIMQELGVCENDVVMISEFGSGSISHNFDTAQPHLITKISCSGHVTFDNGKASSFRPKMTKYKGDLPVQADYSSRPLSSDTGLPF